MGRRMLYGLAAGLLMAGILFVADAANMGKGAAAQILILVMLEAGILLSVSHARKEKAHFSIGEAFKAGLSAAVIASLVFAFGIYYFYEYHKPELLGLKLMEHDAMLVEKGLEGEELEEQLEFARQSFTPYRQALQNMVLVFGYGIVLSLVSAVIMKRRAR